VPDEANEISGWQQNFLSITYRLLLNICCFLFRNGGFLSFMAGFWLRMAISCFVTRLLV